MSSPRRTRSRSSSTGSTRRPSGASSSGRRAYARSATRLQWTARSTTSVRRRAEAATCCRRCARRCECGARSARSATCSATSGACTTPSARRAGTGRSSGSPAARTAAVASDTWPAGCAAGGRSRGRSAPASQRRRASRAILPGTTRARLDGAGGHRNGGDADRRCGDVAFHVLRIVRQEASADAHASSRGPRRLWSRHRVFERGENMSKVPQARAGRRMAALAAVLVFAAVGSSAASGSNGQGSGNDRLSRIDHIVVIYEENHSFDNLYGGWEGVNGRANADRAHTTQIDQNGMPYVCLLQNDVNLNGLPATCNDAAHGFSSAFANTWFTIDPLIPPTATTCPTVLQAFSFPFGVPNGQGLPGGCTRDLVHKFYQEQYQLDGGRQDRYATGSDAAGLSMGVYDTRALPIYRYLHSGGQPHYAIADNFFQSAFGGSFLNHQWLVAGSTPVFPNALSDGSTADRHAVLDRNGTVQTRPFTP